MASTTRYLLSGVLRARSIIRPNAAVAVAPITRAAFGTKIQAATNVTRTLRPTPPSARQQRSIQVTGARWSTTSATGSKIWTFEEIQSLAKSSPSSSSPESEKQITIVDVREPGELQQTGRIPGAVNIPITTSPDSFHITADEFEDRFGFARPAQEDEVVFYCKAGVRSRAAAGMAREAGWAAVGEYPGSWVEWSGKGGAVER